MKATLIVSSKKIREPVKFQTMIIFNDCIECGEQRNTKEEYLLEIRDRKQRITNVSCSCKNITPHLDLVIENEIVMMIQSAGVLPAEEIYW